MYGKVYHIKYPYKARIEAEADKYLVKLRQATSQYETNNCFISFRNDMYSIFDEIFQRLYIELKNNIILIPSKRTEKELSDEQIPQSPCAICGEARVIGRCKIIPAEFGGSSFEDNIIFFCPTHRHLFERNQLNQAERQIIADTICQKASDSIEYYYRVRLGGAQ